MTMEVTMRDIKIQKRRWWRWRRISTFRAWALLGVHQPHGAKKLTCWRGKDMRSEEEKVIECKIKKQLYIFFTCPCCWPAPLIPATWKIDWIMVGPSWYHGQTIMISWSDHHDIKVGPSWYHGRRVISYLKLQTWLWRRWWWLQEQCRQMLQLWVQYNDYNHMKKKDERWEYQMCNDENRCKVKAGHSQLVQQHVQGLHPPGHRRSHIISQ